MSKIIQYVIFVFFAAFPFVITKYFLYGGTSVRSAFLIFTSIVLAVAFCVWALKKDSSIVLPKSLVFLSLGVYFLSIVVSGFLGLDFAVSFWSVLTRTSGIWYFLHLGLFLYFLWLVVSDKKKHNQLTLLIILSTALFSVLSLLGPEGLGWLFKGYKNDGFTFGNSSFAGMYIFGAFLLSLYYLFQAEKKRIWMFVLPVLLLINPYILSKGVWFGDFSSIVGEARLSALVTVFSILGLFVFWLISKIKNRKMFVRVSYGMFAVLVISVAVCSVSLLSLDGFLREKYLSQATAARPLVWSMANQAIADQPVFGWGADNFERIFEKYYDSRLLEGRYGGEAWFDRAHNIFLEQEVSGGFVGLTLYLLVFIVLLLSTLYVFVNTKDKNDRAFSAILFVYFSLHLAELQTVFDTTISYPILGFMLVSAVVLYSRTRAELTGKSQEIILPVSIKYALSVAVVVFCVWSFVWGLVPFVRSQYTNGYIRTIGSAEKRITVYNTLFSSPVDLHAILWRTAADFQRGISQNPKILADTKKVEYLAEEAEIFEGYYREYVKDNPNNFRGKLNIADVLIYQTLFGKNKLDEAQGILDEAIALVPTSPQPYWMKAVGYIYMRKFDLAREYAKKGLEINPEIQESKNIVVYVESSIKTFPALDLYFFRQI